jgi:hypothetical protein
MAFTRFKDDGCEIMKRLQESTDQGFYAMNVPGNGETMAFVADPQIRLQGWGANRHNQFITIENGLRGMNDLLSRDCKYTKQASHPISFQIDKSEHTAQSRTIAPSWELRGTEHPRWDPLLRDPQKHTAVPFQRNEWTHKAKDVVNAYS